jgi:hypothetical protein
LIWQVVRVEQREKQKQLEKSVACLVRMLLNFLSSFAKRVKLEWDSKNGFCKLLKTTPYLGHVVNKQGEIIAKT